MKISTTRQNCASLISATYADMKQVELPVSYFRRAQNTIAHLGYAVTLPTTNAATARQRTQTALNNVLKIIFAYRLRPHSLLTDLDAATDREESIIKTILDNQGNNSALKTQIRYNSSTRDLSDSLEYTIITIDFNTMHNLE